MIDSNIHTLLKDPKRINSKGYIPKCLTVCQKLKTKRQFGIQHTKKVIYYVQWIINRIKNDFQSEIMEARRLVTTVKSLCLDFFL